MWLVATEWDGIALITEFHAAEIRIVLPTGNLRQQIHGRPGKA